MLFDEVSFLTKILPAIEETST